MNAHVRFLETHAMNYKKTHVITYVMCVSIPWKSIPWNPFNEMNRDTRNEYTHSFSRDTCNEVQNTHVMTCVSREYMCVSITWNG